MVIGFLIPMSLRIWIDVVLLNHSAMPSRVWARCFFLLIFFIRIIFMVKKVRCNREKVTIISLDYFRDGLIKRM